MSRDGVSSDFLRHTHITCGSLDKMRTLKASTPHWQFAAPHSCDEEVAPAQHLVHLGKLARFLWIEQFRSCGTETTQLTIVFIALLSHLWVCHQCHSLSCCTKPKYGKINPWWWTRLNVEQPSKYDLKLLTPGRVLTGEAVFSLHLGCVHTERDKFTFKVNG